MLLRRLYDERLAQASYLLGCERSGEALVVDPNRWTEQYLDLAARDGLRVTHVTETHIHADFVSGARDLAERTGAQLHLSGAGGARWQYAYAKDADAVILNDGDCFRVGDVQISAVHTPGHTPEHLSFLVTDTGVAPTPMGALTGDFLFVGDVGRPDLLEKAAHEAGTMVATARMLFASLQRFRLLPDYLQVWPGHGAGSSCGKSLGAVPQSTLGYERIANWAFRVDDEDEFVRIVLDGQPHPPRYFAMMKQMNRDGTARRAESGLARLDAGGVAAALGDGVLVVDTRSAADFRKGALPGSVNIPWNRAFTTYAGSVLPYERELSVLAAGDRELAGRIARELSGIGLDHVRGFFGNEAIEARRGTTADLVTIAEVDVAEVERGLQASSLLDVRSPAEFDAGHIPGALNIPLGELVDRLADVPRDRPLIVHCQSGARAAVAASVLAAHQVDRVRLFSGGVTEWQKQGRPVEGASS